MTKIRKRIVSGILAAVTLFAAIRPEIPLFASPPKTTQTFTYSDENITIEAEIGKNTVFTGGEDVYITDITVSGSALQADETVSGSAVTAETKPRTVSISKDDVASGGALAVTEEKTYSIDDVELYVEVLDETDERFADIELEEGREIKYLDIGFKTQDGEIVKADLQNAKISYTINTPEEAESVEQVFKLTDTEQPTATITEDSDTVVEEITDIETEEKDNTVTFETDSLAPIAVVYTVDFYFGDYEYHLGGGESILLSRLFGLLGIKEDVSNVTDVTFSNPELVKVERVGFNWFLTSLQPFDTEEKLTVTFKNGEVIEIRVTDAVGDITYQTDQGGGTFSNAIGNSFKISRNSDDSENLLGVDVTTAVNGYVFYLWYDDKGNVVSYTTDFTPTSEQLAVSKTFYALAWYRDNRRYVIYTTNSSVMGSITYSGTIISDKYSNTYNRNFSNEVAATSKNSSLYTFEGLYVNGVKQSGEKYTVGNLSNSTNIHTIKAYFIPSESNRSSINLTTALLDENGNVVTTADISDGISLNGTKIVDAPSFANDVYISKSDDIMVNSTTYEVQETTKVTAASPSVSGYSFVGWYANSADDTLLSTAREADLTAAQLKNPTLVAVYQKAPSFVNIKYDTTAVDSNSHKQKMDASTTDKYSASTKTLTATGVTMALDQNYSYIWVDDNNNVVFSANPTGDAVFIPTVEQIENTQAFTNGEDTVTFRCFLTVTPRIKANAWENCTISGTDTAYLENVSVASTSPTKVASAVPTTVTATNSDYKFDGWYYKDSENNYTKIDAIVSNTNQFQGFNGMSRTQFIQFLLDNGHFYFDGSTLRSNNSAIVNIYAKFVENDALKASVSNADEGSVNVTSSLITDGKTTTAITATPKQYYEFDYWEVVSGSVTLDGTKYSAGDKIPNTYTTIPADTVAEKGEIKAYFKLQDGYVKIVYEIKSDSRDVGTITLNTTTTSVNTKGGSFYEIAPKNGPAKGANTTNGSFVYWLDSEGYYNTNTNFVPTGDQIKNTTYSAVFESPGRWIIYKDKETASGITLTIKQGSTSTRNGFSLGRTQDSNITLSGDIPFGKKIVWETKTGASGTFSPYEPSNPSSFTLTADSGSGKTFYKVSLEDVIYKVKYIAVNYDTNESAGTIGSVTPKGSAPETLTYDTIKQVKGADAAVGTTSKAGHKVEFVGWRIKGTTRYVSTDLDFVPDTDVLLHWCKENNAEEITYEAVFREVEQDVKVLKIVYKVDPLTSDDKGSYPISIRIYGSGEFDSQYDNSADSETWFASSQTALSSQIGNTVTEYVTYTYDADDDTYTFGSYMGCVAVDDSNATYTFTISSWINEFDEVIIKEIRHFKPSEDWLIKAIKNNANDPDKIENGNIVATFIADGRRDDNTYILPVKPAEGTGRIEQTTTHSNVPYTYTMDYLFNVNENRSPNVDGSSGRYSIKYKAIPADGYRFSHWEYAGTKIYPSDFLNISNPTYYYKDGKNDTALTKYPNDEAAKSPFGSYNSTDGSYTIYNDYFLWKAFISYDEETGTATYDRTRGYPDFVNLLHAVFVPATPRVDIEYSVAGDNEVSEKHPNVNVSNLFRSYSFNDDAPAQEELARASTAQVFDTGWAFYYWRRIDHGHNEIVSSSHTYYPPYSLLEYANENYDDEPAKHTEEDTGKVVTLRYEAVFGPDYLFNVEYYIVGDANATLLNQLTSTGQTGISSNNSSILGTRLILNSHYRLKQWTYSGYDDSNLDETTVPSSANPFVPELFELMNAPEYKDAVPVTTIPAAGTKVTGYRNTTTGAVLNEEQYNSLDDDKKSGYESFETEYTYTATKVWVHKTQPDKVIDNQAEYDALSASDKALFGEFTTKKLNQPIKLYAHLEHSNVLKIEKAVTGNLGSKDQYFPFNVVITNGKEGNRYNISYTNATQEIAANPNAASSYITTAIHQPSRTVAANSEGRSEFTIYLQHGQSIEITGLPDGAIYQITEADNDYKTEYKVNFTKVELVDGEATVKPSERADIEDTTKTISAFANENEDATVVFTNKKSGILPTGIAANGVLSIMTFIIALLAMAIFNYRKNKVIDV